MTDSFTIEAEVFATKSGVKTWDDNNVSDGKYVEFIDDIGYISTTFSVSKSGNFLIVPYVYSDSAKGNRVYLSVDGRPEKMIGGRTTDSKRWIYINGMVENLNAGNHTLEIRAWDRPNRIDLIVIHELTTELTSYPYGLFVNANNPPFNFDSSGLRQRTLEANSIGQKALRPDFNWADIEPIPGFFQWDKYDIIRSGIDNIGNGLTIVAILGYPTSVRYGPAWALPIANYTAAFGRFVGQVVSRYGTNRIVYEIVNEPNNGAPPSSYAGLLRAAYTNANAANASATILYGGTLGVATSWISQTFVGGVLGYFDEIAIHPYQGYSRSFEEQGMDWKLGEFAAFLRGNGVDPGKSWWTEYGMLRRNQEFHAQARVISRAMILGAKSGFPVEGMIPYTGPYYNSFFDESSGTNNDTGDAYKFIISNFAGAAYRSSLELPPDVRGYLFRRASDQILAIWSLDMPAQDIIIRGISSAKLYNYTGGENTNFALSGGSANLNVEGDVQYLVIPLSDNPYTAGYNYGTNFAAASSGATVSVSSERPGYKASYIIDGVRDARDTANGYQWNDNTMGQFPDTVEIDLGREQTIDTVIIYTHSNNSSPGGLRDFDLQVLQGGSWQTIEAERGNYNYWVLKYQFAPMTTSKVRLVIQAVNDGLDNNSGVKALYSRLYEVEVYRANTAPVD